MQINNLGKTTHQRRWTNTAIECYLRGCVCNGCLLNDLIFKDSLNNCHMKATVLELVRVLGRPAIVDNHKRNFLED